MQDRILRYDADRQDRAQQYLLPKRENKCASIWPAKAFTEKRKTKIENNKKKILNFRQDDVCAKKETDSNLDEGNGYCLLLAHCIKTINGKVRETNKAQPGKNN